MARYYGFSFVILMALCLVNSCKDESITTETGVFHISSLSPEKAYTGSEINISGNEFGQAGDSSFVLFDSAVVVKSSDCLKWNNSLVRLEVPVKARSGNVRIIKGRDTSNSVNIIIDKLPPLELAEIQPGTFSMGSEAGSDNESPIHQVSITKGFFISKTEITNQMWNAVLAGNPANFKDISLPASNISWHEAVYFCNGLSKIMGYDSCYVIKGDTVEWEKSANGFRLPTEAEWEYACRAGSNNEISGTGNPDDMAWHSSNSGFKPHPPAVKSSNAWGLFDMHGNVWEWCWDWYSSTYYKSSPANDPAGPESGSIRVLRGGSWHDGLLFLRSPNRTYPEASIEFAGLRVVRTKQ